MKILERPLLVMVVCFIFLVASLILDGTVTSIQRLKQETQMVELKSQGARLEIEQIRLKLKESEETRFIEKRALEYLDLASENDILFVFSDEAEAPLEPRQISQSGLNSWRQ